MIGDAETGATYAEKAIAAFEAGDYRKAATNTGLALLDAAGAIAGPVGAAVKTATTKSRRKFVKVSARRAAQNVENRYTQIRFGRSEAARRYFQWTIRRTALKTSEAIERAAEPALEALPTEQKQRLASVLESASNLASEAFIDRKLRTWGVEVASEYQMGVLARAERAAAKAGDKEMQSAIGSQITAEKTKLEGPWKPNAKHSPAAFINSSGQEGGASAIGANSNTDQPARPQKLSDACAQTLVPANKRRGQHQMPSSPTFRKSRTLS